MKSVVYLSPVPWASISQRPHKFAEWFHARRGGSVLWVDPYPTRLPTWQDLRRMRAGVQEPAQDVPDWLQLHTVRTPPIEPLPFSAAVQRASWGRLREAVRDFASGGDCELVVGKPSKLARHIMDMDLFSRVTYDAMDDFPAFYTGLSRAAFAFTEEQVARRADRIVVSSEALARKFAGSREVILARNACDPARLPTLQQVASLREPDLVGYIGTIASWFDWPLVLGLARARPDLRFRLTGPVYATLPSDLPPNVSILPACSHEEAMLEMARFAVGLIPFHRTSLTRAVDPVKYYEYRAMGTPVLSTAFGEMVAHARDDAGVFLTTGDGTSALQSALAHRDPPGLVDEMRAANAWHARFDVLDQARPSHAPSASQVIAVVVTFRPDPAPLRRMLLALTAQVARVCVVDNSEDGGAALAEAARDVPVHSICLGRNAGIAHAQNVGIDWALDAGASHVLLMDQDSLPAPDMVRRLSEALETRPNAAGVGPRYVDPRTGHSEPFVRIEGLKRRRLPCDANDGLVEVDHLIASGCLIPASVLKHVGLMRGDLFIDYVDIEWGLRARKLGLRSYGVCAAHMEHALGDDHIRVGARFIPAHSPLRHYYQVRNAVLVLRESTAFLAWRILDTKRVLAMLTLFSIARPPRLQHLRMMAVGLWHGLTGKAGSYDEARAGLRSQRTAPSVGGNAP